MAFFFHSAPRATYHGKTVLQNHEQGLLGIYYLGSHTMSKIGAYRVYTQSNYNIGLVVNFLNHSSEAMTLAYLG
jgi:hypothetical protein